jgi:hypothetical protein
MRAFLWVLANEAERPADLSQLLDAVQSWSNRVVKRRLIISLRIPQSGSAGTLAMRSVPLPHPLLI